ncbi:sperm acrosome membrane-associated protein 4-like [Ahaetulla prasina]|uniref:sperm acrosome membrane-associated protein 4-like n=1 Tax=Ahaetulla prasina TaxID=499056 RepID=UPI00264A4329|nr:sperm acrosome membrane-associated protein 4-like [Ahaetulla prasina]
MKCSLQFSLVCVLVCLLPSTVSKDCIFCEITSSTICPGLRMSCAEDEDCFVGEGVALGVSDILNKGCTRSINCGKEQPVAYMGVTYSLVTNCCKGNLCNEAQSLRGPSLFLQFALISLLRGLL